MNPDFNETQVLLRDTVRGYLEAEHDFARVRELEATYAPDDKLWALLIEQGWLGTAFPEALGGGGGGVSEAGIVVHELARRAAQVPVVEVVSSLLAILRKGDAGRAAELVQQMLAGTCIPVPAVLEGSDRFDQIEAEVDAQGRLRGTKSWVDYAQFATHHIVAAKDARGALGLYCVLASDPAAKAEPIPVMGRTQQASVRYDGAAAERVGDEASLRLLIQLARAFTSVQIVACMEQSVEMTVKYTNQREQFGAPLATFQAVQHHAANMATLTESNHFLAYEVFDALERGDASDEQVALLKASVSRAVPEVTMLGHQLHGGQGFIEENDLYFFTLRGRDRANAWGSAEECLAIVAETVEDAPPPM